MSPARPPVPRVVLAPSLSSLAALGVADARVLLEGAPPAAELIVEQAGERRLRLALPGTPGPDGRLRGRPGGAGTGWVVLQCWIDPPLGLLLAARLRAPRSASPAEREWNLLCHLRGAGVGTPEPLAVGAIGRGPASRRSFLVTRELRGFVPLAAFARRELSASEEALAVRAAATFLARLLRSGFVVDRLRASAIGVRAELPEERPADAGPEQACTDEPPSGRRNRMPGLVLSSVRGGRLAPSAGLRAESRRWARMLATLAAELSLAGVQPRRLRGVLRGVLRALTAPRRRALLAALRRAGGSGG